MPSIVTITTIAAVAAVISTPMAVAAQPQPPVCLTLPNNSACGPDFEGYQISPSVASDIDAFNNYVKSNSNLDGNTDAFKATLKAKYACSVSPQGANLSLRDQQRIVFASTRLLDCYHSKRLRWLSATQINDEDCNRSLVAQTNTTLFNQCSAWDASSAEAGAPPCYDGTPSEVTNCGFASPYLAKEYCYVSANAGTSECCMNLLKSNPTPAFGMNSPSPFALLTNAYSNIRFTLSSTVALLCLRDENEYLTFANCNNVYGHGKSQFTYNLRDRTIKSLATGRCLEAITFSNGQDKPPSYAPQPKKCIATSTDSPDSFKRQKWSVIAGVDAGFTADAVPTFKIVSEELGNVGCLILKKNVDGSATYVGLGSCSSDAAAVQFAGFGAY
ncbi:hypothetical protein HDU97_002490 [Phlyctochytrium planicorne]|nr:hypothetical protein HDU97_002490 [Phlyctochytrium planicorne]